MGSLSGALWITGSYVVCFGLIYWVFNFLTKSFFHNYIKVFASRGRLILVEAVDVTDTYYKAGKIDSKRNLIIKDRYGKIHIFNKIDNSFILRRLGVNSINVNLVNGSIIKKDFSNASTYDLTMTDDLVNRALMLPKLIKNNKEMIMWLLLAIIIVGVGVVIYLLLSQNPATLSCPVVSNGVNI